MKSAQKLLHVPVSPPASQATDCRALVQLIGQVGDKWTVLVVGVLSLGPSRFNALMRDVPGISHRMLTLTLRALERDGLVKRTAFATIPPRVDYELTELGRSLTEPLRMLAEWAASKQSLIEIARHSYDRARAMQA